MFNGVEFRGIGRQEQKPASSILGSRKQPLFGMERGVVHYNHGTLVEGRQKLIGKPEFKKTTVHRPAILKRREDLIRYFSGDNATALIFSAADSPGHLLAPWRIPVFPIQICIDAAFIHIGELSWRHIFDSLLIHRYFLPILLPVTGRLFFRVILYR